MGDTSNFYVITKVRELDRTRDCCLVLFYLPQDPQSQDLKQVWSDLSATLAGINFLAVNASVQSEIMKAFYETGQNPDNPLYPFAVEGFPTIMGYRDSYPQCFYNGEKSYDPLLQFCLTLLCRSGYYESENLYIGTSGAVPEEDAGLGITEDGREIPFVEISSSRAFGGDLYYNEAGSPYNYGEVRETADYRAVEAAAGIEEYQPTYTLPQ